MSKTTPAAKIRSDGTVVELLFGGTEWPFPESSMRPMTEAEIEAAAGADPDARPMTTEELRPARPVPRIKTLRRAPVAVAERVNGGQPEMDFERRSRVRRRVFQPRAAIYICCYTK